MAADMWINDAGTSLAVIEAAEHGELLDRYYVEGRWHSSAYHAVGAMEASRRFRDEWDGEDVLHVWRLQETYLDEDFHDPA